MKNGMRRFVVFFDEATVVKGTKHLTHPKHGRPTRPTRTYTTRLAKGPVDAYRKATGWTGMVSSSNGYEEQKPVRRVSAYNSMKGLTMEQWQRQALLTPPPPAAGVVPLGEW